MVTLVANEHDGGVGVAILSHFFEPARQMRERVPPRDIVDEQSASSTSVVGAGDGLKRFLASSVPNLQLDVLVVDLNRAGSEFDANRQIVLLTEALVCKLEEQAGLADTYLNC